MTQGASVAIDFDHLRQYTGGDDALVADVLTMFTDGTARWLSALDPAADDATWSGVAHALKGSALTVGATGLGEVCERAEAMVGEGDWTARREWAVEEIAARVADVQAEIGRWMYDYDLKRLRDQ